jgi:ATP-binding cassette subfamily C protein LapB
MLELVDRIIVVANQQVLMDGPKAQVLQRLQAPPTVTTGVRAA